MNATRKRRKIPIISTSGGFAGEFTIREQKAGEIKWHLDEEGRVVCDMDSF
jgi:vacuolar-type H+-ATPase subunit B/Vma2